MDKILKLPIEYIKVGQFIRWQAERVTKSWDCIGVITNVDYENSIFSVTTLDDNKIVKDILFYTVDKSEFSISDAKEAKAYLLSLLSKERINLIKLEEQSILTKDKIDCINKTLKEYSL